MRLQSTHSYVAAGEGRRQVGIDGVSQLRNAGLLPGQKAKPRSIDRVVSRMGRSMTFAAPSGQIWMEGGQQQHPYRDGLSILAPKFGGVIKIVMSVFSSDVRAHPPTGRNLVVR